METMKEFMLLFRLEPVSRVLNEEEILQMHQQWQKYIGEIAAQSKLVGTSRLSFEAGVVLTRSGQTVDGIYVTDGQAISGNMIVKAETMNEAIELAKNCPVLKLNGSVEVRFILPMN